MTNELQEAQHQLSLAILVIERLTSELAVLRGDLKIQEQSVIVCVPVNNYVN